MRNQYIISNALFEQTIFTLSWLLNIYNDLRVINFSQLFAEMLYKLVDKNQSGYANADYIYLSDDDMVALISTLSTALILNYDDTKLLNRNIVLLVKNLTIIQAESLTTEEY